MNKIGFIGLGHMASALVRAFISSKAIPSKSLIISNRSPNKLKAIKACFPGLKVENDNSIVAKESDIIFICVNTNEVINVINEIRPNLSKAKHIVIISGGLEIASVEVMFKEKISKLIPTLTCEVYQGTSLISHNENVTKKDKEKIDKLLRKIGKVKVVTEKQFAVYTVLSSCAPGLIASIFDQFCRSASICENIDYQDCFDIVLSSLLGTSLLLSKNSESFNDLISRVARKGGNTELGVRIFENKLPRIYNDVIKAVTSNEKRRNEFTRKQFGAQPKREIRVKTKRNTNPPWTTSKTGKC
jgi:pyrroline-5-carboxylate reductase